MRALKNKTNVIAPGGDYPYGRLKDNPGNNTGTPVDENLLGDASQFFEKLMAEGGIAPNGKPENSSDGFQLFDALKNVINSSAPTWSNTGIVFSSDFDELYQGGVYWKNDKNSRTITVYGMVKCINSVSNNSNILTINFDPSDVLSNPVPAIDFPHSSFGSIGGLSQFLAGIRIKTVISGGSNPSKLIMETATGCPNGDLFDVNFTIPY